MDNYPNPFNPSTNISFTIPAQGKVTVTIYNALGQEVAVLADRSFNQGMHTLTWNAENASSGLYIYSIDFNGARISKKMTLLK